MSSVNQSTSPVGGVPSGQPSPAGASPTIPVVRPSPLPQSAETLDGRASTSTEGQSKSPPLFRRIFGLPTQRQLQTSGEGFRRLQLLNQEMKTLLKTFPPRNLEEQKLSIELKTAWN